MKLLLKSKIILGNSNNIDVKRETTRSGGVGVIL